MMYNMPKDSNTVDIEKDADPNIKGVYPTATIERLSKDGKQLRTVKVQYNTSTDMEHTVKNDIPLDSLFDKCHLSESVTMLN